VTKEEMAKLIEQSAELGARKALRDIGLSDDDALSDVSELRGLLESWRAAKRTVAKTVLQAITTLVLGGLLAGSYFNFFNKQWSMIGEIALLIKGLDTAFNLVQASLKKKKQVEQMGAEISGFFASKEAVEDKIAESKKNNGYSYSGSPLEEAIQIQNQEDRLADMMKTIGDEYSRQGKSPQWQKVQKNAANIQKNRDLSMAESNRKKILQDRKNDDFYLALKLIVGLVMLMAAITGLVFVLAINWGIQNGND
jgi:hypothetical protein